MGFGLLVVAILGLFARRFTGRSMTWREGLLISWVIVPFAFFQIWPVKGFSYLEPLAPAIAMLGARSLVPAADALKGTARRVGQRVLVAAVVLSMAIPAAVGV